ncbi:hypothetical protein V8C86DRAFT_2817451 [Haematococcus lacustris]
MKPQLAGSYSFRLCWSWDCLANPASFNPAARVTIVAAAVPVPTFDTPPAGSGLLASFMAPSCATMTASVALTNTDLQDIALDVNQAVIVPSTGLNGITYVVSTRANCDNQYAGALVSRAYPSLPQPAVPRSSCACAAVPGAGGACSGIQIPITLTTLSAAQGQSTRQCIDPGNFDFFTNEFAFSYCWRYACLPDVFASSDFTATVTDLDRFNVKNMPAGAVYNATVKATPGVKLSVTAKPKAAGVPVLYFDNSGTALPNGDWVSGNVTSPASGISNFTFVFTVPVGFDDLSAAVTMELYPDQNLPPAPPAPPGTICRCPDVPDASGACPEGETLALVTRPGSNITLQQCLFLPNYDVFQQQFAFSTCWRWSCLSLAFRGPQRPEVIKPYTITVPNITQYNLDQMPGGLSRLQVLKPLTANISVTLHPPGATSIAFGPWNATGDVVLPPATASMDIVIDVPGLAFVDNNSGAVVIQPGPAPPSPPAPPPAPPRPPLPPGTAAGANVTVLVAKFYVLRTIRNQTELDDIFVRTSADVQANISSYLLTLPVGFSDFTSVPDCTPASRIAFTTSVANSLGLTLSRVTTTCRYGATLQRRRGRALSQICNEAVQLSVQIDFDPAAAQVVGPTNLAGPTSNALSNTFGSNLCGFGTPILSTGITVTQPQTRSGSVSSQCSALASSLAGLTSRDVTNLQCTSVIPNPNIANGGAPSNGDNGGSALVNSPATSNAVIGGAVGGAIGGLALLALVAFFVVKSRKHSVQNRAAPPTSAAPPRRPRVETLTLVTDPSFVQDTRPIAAMAAAAGPARGSNPRSALAAAAASSAAAVAASTAVAQARTTTPGSIAPDTPPRPTSAPAQESMVTITTAAAVASPGDATPEARSRPASAGTTSTAPSASPPVTLPMWDCPDPNAEDASVQGEEVLYSPDSNSAVAAAMAAAAGAGNVASGLTAGRLAELRPKGVETSGLRSSASSTTGIVTPSQLRLNQSLSNSMDATQAPEAVAARLAVLASEQGPEEGGMTARTSRMAAQQSVRPSSALPYNTSGIILSGERRPTQSGPGLAASTPTWRTPRTSATGAAVMDTALARPPLAPARIAVVHPQPLTPRGSSGQRLSPDASTTTVPTSVVAWASSATPSQRPAEGSDGARTSGRLTGRTSRPQTALPAVDMSRGEAAPDMEQWVRRIMKQ